MWSPPSEPHRRLLAPAFPRDRALLDVWGADLFKGGSWRKWGYSWALTPCPLGFAAIAGRITCNGDSALGHGWPELHWLGGVLAAG